MKQKYELKTFGPTAWAVENKMTVYVITILITILGIITYSSLPKENFPDIVIPTILVTTINAGTSPSDVETLITRQIEKQIKSVANIKRVTSQSFQDASIITVEFTTGIEPSVAKQRVKDAVDKSRSDLPTDLTLEPSVIEIDFSEFPIMNVNIAGDVSLERLKKYADNLQDKVEALKEIRRVDIIGALDREVQVNLDPFKMQSAQLSFNDVARAIANENVNISGGDLVAGGVRRNLRITGEFTSPKQIEGIVVGASGGSTFYLRDVATVIETNKEQQSYSRLNGKPVISLAILKKAGENLINASDKVMEIKNEFQKTLPKGVVIDVTGDQSDITRTNLTDLINSIIIGFILVTVILMFFMGVQNALFVGLATPLSAFLSFLLMPTLDITFNLVVTFAFLLALGIIVDDAIVVIENMHRLHKEEGLDINLSAKVAAKEVFAPVVAGTLTTLAPFFPLLFWPGIVGEFMVYLPAVLIMSLTASLIVAYIINPVFAVQFMEEKNIPLPKQGLILRIAVMGGIGLFFHLLSLPLYGNLTFILLVLWLLNKYFLTPVLIKGFQNVLLPKLMDFYKGTLSFVIKGKRPYAVIAVMFVILIGTFMALGIVGPKVVFFPDSEPNFAYVYIQMPIGTDAAVTDSITAIVEKKVMKIIGDKNPIVNSVISNVGIGAGDPQDPDRTVAPHKGKVSVAFVKFAERNGKLSSDILNRMQEEIKDIPGAEISVETEAGGPPTGKPVNIEISGDDFDMLVTIEQRMKKFVTDSLRVKGIQMLKSSLQKNKPEVLVNLDREKANLLGLSAGQIGFELRSALYGLEASKYRVADEEYPINVRLEERYRQDINSLMNMPMVFRASNGQLKEIPISSVSSTDFTSTYASIYRKNLKRVVTLSSGVVEGFNANEINQIIREALPQFSLPEGYEVKLTGEQEDQEETSAFLGLAFMISIAFIFMIMVTQFNSIAKPILIMVTVLLSTIGVFAGFMLFRIDISIVFTGVGIIALGGIVVRNGIVLVDFTDVLLDRGYKIRTAIVDAGAIRFNPVILTAATTALGLIPLAVGLNINFESLLTTGNPHFHLGGDSVAFWGPLAWAIIFGLTFSTFLTLVIVPCMYLVQYGIQLKFKRRSQRNAMKLEEQLKALNQ
ncbi:MAG: efflux RND transporter permease subunit [Candidatus Kapabacteria bacterium]|nr:efflux RND transporter permease subunit [Candidatus Kapabacteria bacterium]